MVATQKGWAVVATNSNDCASARLRILVVEDNALQAAALVQALEDGGYDAVGPYRCEEDALRLVRRERIDAAILDLDLGGGGRGESVASTLSAMGIPFIFISGSDRRTILREMGPFSHVRKPVSPAMVLRVLAANLNGAGSGVRRLD